MAEGERLVDLPNEGVKNNRHDAFTEFIDQLVFKFTLEFGLLVAVEEAAFAAREV